MIFDGKASFNPPPPPTSTCLFSVMSWLRNLWWRRHFWCFVIFCYLIVIFVIFYLSVIFARVCTLSVYFVHRYVWRYTLLYFSHRILFFCRLAIIKNPGFQSPFGVTSMRNEGSRGFHWIAKQKMSFMFFLVVFWYSCSFFAFFGWRYSEARVGRVVGVTEYIDYPHILPVLRRGGGGRSLSYPATHVSSDRECVPSWLLSSVLVEGGKGKGEGPTPVQHHTIYVYRHSSSTSFLLSTEIGLLNFSVVGKMRQKYIIQLDIECYIYR